MEWAWLIGAAAALPFGLLIGWLARGGREQAAREERARALAEMAHYKARADALEPQAARVAGLSADIARLQATQAERDAGHAQQLAAMREEFGRVAGDALATAQAAFAAQAGETLKAHREATAANLEGSKAALADLIKPVNDTLTRYQESLRDIEGKREQAYGGLTQAIAQVALGQQAVRDEAAKLTTALRTSGKASGAWGEAQLRNVLELAGLRHGIDFSLQESVHDEEGRQRRPDAVINLPGGRKLVVDSKCSLNDYLEAAGSTADDARRASLARHAAAVKAHVGGLSAKAYWNEFAQAADFVVMFLPGENFLSAALEQDLSLMADAMKNKVLLAGPINLLALAKTVALVWKQETLAEEAHAIGAEAAALYAGLSKMSEHVGRLGKNLTQTVESYNEFIGSMERNVLPKARRLPEMGVDKGRKELPDLRVIEAAARPVTAHELLPRPDKAA